MVHQSTIVLLLVLGTVLGDPLVQLPNGQVRGFEATTFEKKQFYGFEGIPFAEPPIGSLRFQAPQPALNWDGILNATSFSKTCFQTAGDSDLESEDCLYINVFTPQLPSEDSNATFPTLIFIYGGGFNGGSSRSFSPDLFINKDVILVTFNYRVGVFGFLSTQDEIIPGNAGLKDQQLAFRWTYDNIRFFGGDPNKITIGGQSAGAASVGYQLLNPNNKGLFQGAILESGTFLSPWAFKRDAREMAFKIGIHLNSDFRNNNDSQALLDYLQSVEARDLDAAAYIYHLSANIPPNLEVFNGYIFTPVIEVEHPNAVFTKKMYGMLKNGEFITVPTIIGINSEESINGLPGLSLTMIIMENFDKHLQYLVPEDMRVEDEATRLEIGTAIREVYTKGQPLADDIGDAIRYCSDHALTRSIIKHGELASKFSNVFFYQFSYDGELGHNDAHYDGAESVGHSEELRYLSCSGKGCDASQYPEQDRLTRQRLVELWSNFIKYQNPTPEPSDLLQNVTWPTVDTTEGHFYYLDINENLEIKNHPKQETFAFWNATYNSLGYDDFDTY